MRKKFIILIIRQSIFIFAEGDTLQKEYIDPR